VQRAVPIALGAAFIAACVLTPVPWSKPNATDDVVAEDFNDCRRLALDQRLASPPSLESEQAFIDSCMRSKGYRLERVPR
jgi:hypothetical protein